MSFAHMTGSGDIPEEPDDPGAERVKCKWFDECGEWVIVPKGCVGFCSMHRAELEKRVKKAADEL